VNESADCSAGLFGLLMKHQAAAEPVCDPKLFATFEAACTSTWNDPILARHPYSTCYNPKQGNSRKRLIFLAF
jgi:hypothetical protein